MQTRRKFIKQASLGSLGVMASGLLASCETGAKPQATPMVPRKGPLVISTWNHGIPANEAAMKKLQDGGSALDAAEAGVMVVESDPENGSVGLSGMPDRDGHVTLDACVMDEHGNCGSVCFLEQIKHPVSVARMVMDKTPHVMLVGEGAQQFALENGFVLENQPLNKAQLDEWAKWKETSHYKPVINIENHDTIGLLVMDKNGNFSGACTTSGLAWKPHGRVGDSPVIGAGLYVDNEVGAATATGLGEAVLRTLGSFLIVELMRNGSTPQQACEEAVKRIIKRHPNSYMDLQVGFLAVNKQGEIGAYSVHPGFNYALYHDGENKMHDSTSFTQKQE